jgi:hypothetical protein
MGRAKVGVVSGESRLNFGTVEQSICRAIRSQVRSIRFRKANNPQLRPSLVERPVAVQTAILPVAFTTGSLPGRTSGTPITNRYPRRDGKEPAPVAGPDPCRWSRFLSMLTETEVDSKKNPLDIAIFSRTGRGLSSLGVHVHRSSATVPAKPGSNNHRLFEARERSGLSFDSPLSDPGIVRLHGGSQIRFFSSCMLSPRPRISLVRTSKLAGVPASRVFSPLTIDS